MITRATTGAVLAAAMLGAAPAAFARDIDASVLCPGPPNAMVACTAPPPLAGQAFSGPVLQVIDGRTLCIAQGPTPNEWIRVRLDGAADANPRDALMAASFGRRVACVAGEATGQGLIARCSLNGVDLGASASASSRAQQTMVRR